MDAKCSKNLGKIKCINNFIWEARPLEIYRCSWKHNTKAGLRKTRSDIAGPDSYFAEKKVMKFCDHGSECLSSIKGGKLLASLGGS
jgi:hypothetical protein